MVQAFINMGVAVNVLPVTGQTLPLISAGGSSIWMSCLALGMILSVSRETKSSANETMPKNDEEEEGGSVHALSNA
jgi:cell division protein FtsW